jgi:hypothetical protein
MKKALLVWTTGLAVLAQVGVAQSEKPLTARPVQRMSCAVLPADMAFDVKPMGHEAGFEIYYLVEGESIAAVKDDSLVVDAILTKDGKDISKSRTGKSAYEQGPWPKVSEDGKYAVFSVKSDADQFGNVESLSIKGSITVQTANQRDKKNATLVLAEKQPKSVGPFTVAVEADSDEAAAMRGNNLGLRVTGPQASLIDVSVATPDGKALEPEGSTWDDTSKTFFFEKSATPSVTVEVNYWTDLVERKVVFGQ